jgi:hypothetical protein
MNLLNFRHQAAEKLRGWERSPLYEETEHYVDIHDILQIVTGSHKKTDMNFYKIKYGNS